VYHLAQVSGEEKKQEETTTIYLKGMNCRANTSALRLQKSALFTHSLSQRLFSEAVPRVERSTKQSRFKYQQASWRDINTTRDKASAILGCSYFGTIPPLDSHLSVMECYFSPHSFLISSPEHWVLNVSVQHLQSQLGQQYLNSKTLCGSCFSLGVGGGVPE